MNNEPWDWHKRYVELKKQGIELERDDNEISENGILWRAVPWDIRRESRAWDKPEIEIKYFRCLQEIKEMTEGKLYWCDATRMVMLGLRLENLRIDKAIRLGDLELWEQALANRKQQEGNLNTQI